MNLRWKLFVPQLLIVVGIAVYIWGVWMPATLSELSRARLQLIERHLDTIEQGLIPLILGNRLDMVQENLAALTQKNIEWTSVTLLDARGRQLYPPRVGAVTRPQPAQEYRHRVERTVGHEGTTLGTLAVDLDMASSLASDRAQNNRFARLVLLLLGAMLITTHLTLELMVRRPLRQLVNAAEALSRREFSAPLPAATDDEVGALVSSFASMRDNLSLFQERLIDEVNDRRQAEAHFRALVENLPDHISRFDEAVCFTYASPKIATAFGLSDRGIIGLTIAEALPALGAETAALMTERVKQVFATGIGSATELLVTLPSGPKTLEIRYFPEPNQSGKVTSVLGICRDVTERIHMMESLKLLSAAVEQSPVSVLITDVTGIIQYVNPAFCANSLYTPEEVIGKNPRMLQDDSLEKQDYADLWTTIQQGNPWHGTFRNLRKDGTRHWEEVIIAPIRDVRGAITRFIGIQQDITARKEAEDKATFLAQHDALTKLPNRLLAQDRMQMAMRAADRNATKAALMFLDLDGFKHVNDSLGHQAGDALLTEVSERLQRCVRRTDTVARLGGDEFLLIFADITEPQTLTTLAHATLTRMASPYIVDGNELSVTGSLGVAVYPDDGHDWDTLFKKADAAMYSSKESGRNTYRFFTGQMNTNADEYLQLHSKLQRALERREFVLHYQPQVNLRTGVVGGVEALIRWNSPELGLVLPGRFITLAEESGLIVPIGAWVLEEACRQAVAWQRAGLPRICMAVNLSAVQFRNGNLLETVRRALEASGLDPSLLELEMTESILIKDTSNVLATVRELKAMGIRLAIDDFGTGFSSLSYLKRFNADKVKIDQSFVRDITMDTNSSVIVATIVRMAQGLGLTTIAEGVETDFVRVALLKHQCDEAQGYYFGKPMSAEQVRGYLKGNAETGT